ESLEVVPPSEAMATGAKTSAPPFQPIAMFLKTDPLAGLAVVVLALVVIAALVAPLVAPYATNEFAGPPGEAPSWRHLFGTDQLGRDSLSRIMFGARTSLAVGVGSVMIGAAGGGLIGLIGGFTRGWASSLIRCGVDMTIAFPQLILL